MASLQSASRTTQKREHICQDGTALEVSLRPQRQVGFRKAQIGLGKSWSNPGLLLPRMNTWTSLGPEPMCFHPAGETNRLLWVAGEGKPKGREGIQAIRIASCQVLATRQEAFQIGSCCQSRDAADRADTIVSKLFLYIFM